MSRCDSAAMVSNTSELLPEPETPVNTVSRRFGISTLTSLRLFTRASCTRISSWLSASCSAADRAPLLVALLLVSGIGLSSPPSYERTDLRLLKLPLLGARSPTRLVALLTPSFAATAWSAMSQEGAPPRLHLYRRGV